MNVLPRQSFAALRRAALAHNICKQLRLTRCFSATPEEAKGSTSVLSTIFGGNKESRNGEENGNDDIKIRPPVRLYSKTGIQATTLYSEVISEALKSQPYVIDTVTSDLQEFAKLVSDPYVAFELSNPAASPAGLAHFVEQVANKAGFQPISKDFLLELAESKQLNLINGIVQDYSKLVNTLLRRYTVHVTVARKEDQPTEQQVAELFGFPEDARITFDVETDESLISGYIASTEEQSVDRSLSTQVAALRKALVAANSARVDREWAAIKEDLQRP